MTVPTLVYAFDPLCGWCYAFGPSFAALKEAVGDRATWEIALGGLATGDRVGPIGRIAPMLRQGRARLEAASSVRFGPGLDAVLDDGTWVADSEPPCRAICWVVDHHGHDLAAAFGEALIEGFYAHGHLPDAPSSLEAAATAAGLDPAPLLAGWTSDHAKARVQAMWAASRSQGVSSYPHVYVRHNGRLHAILPGFVPPDEAVKHVSKVLDRLEA